ncbi:MAG TPA: lysyl oxidase family protein, partial [Nocardioidaceae bacterium]|nr:lysyl oxidase family protein [Nocardioidaceae bacterium]
GPAASGKGEPLLPNLVVLRARDLHIVRKGTERKLRFESGLANVGDGPIEVRPNRLQECPKGKHHASQLMYRDVDKDERYSVDVDTRTARRSAGCMVFHPYHDHWHFEAASRYTLYKADRPELSKVAQRKMSFCLRDSRRVPKSFGTFPYANRYGACSRYSPQGISVGWVDVYQSYLAGQAIRLPRRMGDGLYCLRIKVDPKDQLLETVDNDNSSLRAFYLRGDRIRYRDSARCRPVG